MGISKYRGAFPSQWSDWDWNVQHACYVRYRLVSKSKNTIPHRQEPSLTVSQMTMSGIPTSQSQKPPRNTTWKNTQKIILSIIPNILPSIPAALSLLRISITVPGLNNQTETPDTTQIAHPKNSKTSLTVLIPGPSIHSLRSGSHPPRIILRNIVSTANSTQSPNQDWIYLA